MKVFIVVIVMLCSTQLNAHAAMLDEKIANELHTDELVEQVPTNLQDLVSDVNLLSGEGLSAAFAKLKGMFLQSVTNEVSSVFKPASKALLIVILCSVAASIIPGERGELIITLAGGTAIVYLMMGQAQSFFQHSLETIGRLYDFSTVLLPCLAGAAIFSGATISAGTKYTAAVLFMNVLFNFCNTILVPMIAAYLTCATGGCVFQQQILSSVAKFIQKASTTVLTGVVVIFTTYLSVAGLITSAGDNFATQATKTALSTALPVVGRIVSDSAATLVAGAGLVRSCIGAFGLIVILGILITPFVGLGLRYLLFKSVGVIGDLFPQQKLSGLISAIAGAFGLMLAVLGTGFVMMFMSLISFMYLHGG